MCLSLDTWWSGKFNSTCKSHIDHLNNTWNTWTHETHEHLLEHMEHINPSGTLKTSLGCPHMHLSFSLVPLVIVFCKPKHQDIKITSKRITLGQINFLQQYFHECILSSNWYKSLLFVSFCFFSIEGGITLLGITGAHLFQIELKPVLRVLWTTTWRFQHKIC